MNFYFHEYKHVHAVYSVAFSREIAEVIEHRGLSPILFEGNNATILKDNVLFKLSDKEYAAISSSKDCDVIELYPNGLGHWIYQADADDNMLFITSKCNSNCIMCPSSNHARKNGELPTTYEFLNIIDHIPSDAKHITITGGEPFMIGDGLFEVFAYLRSKLNRSNFLLLTNGRAFAIDGYPERFTENMPSQIKVAIPIHGHTSALHDAISRSEDSFIQTCIGIRELLKRGVQIELRIVVSALNINYLMDIANFIISEFSGAYCVNFIGLEMLGNAAVNEKIVWIPYRKSFDFMKEAIDLLIYNAIDVGIYNYPLCTIPPAYWPLCQCSISGYKITYNEKCDGCDVRSLCGGIFNGSNRLIKNDINPIKAVI